MSCCPENSLKFLAPSYVTSGQIQTLPNGHEFYSSGIPAATLKKAVIIIPDIYGWNGCGDLAPFLTTHMRLKPRTLTAVAQGT